MAKTIDRASTGIPALDEILEGGFPRPSSVLITGDIGTNKNTFAQQIMYHGLKHGEKAIYITVDAFPDDLLDNMAKYGWDARKFFYEDKLVFIDGFSPRVGVESSAQYLLENPFDLDEVIRTIVMAEREVFEDAEKARLVFSHVSTIFFTAPKEKIPYFIERLHAEARKYNGIYMLVYTEGVKDKYTETFMKQLPDVVITLHRISDLDQTIRYFEITRCIKTRYPRNPFKYHLTRNGIVVEKPEKLVY